MLEDMRGGVEDLRRDRDECRRQAQALRLALPKQERRERARPLRGGAGCELQAECHRQRCAGIDAETFLGAILIAAWAAVVVRGLEQTAVAARKGRKWERAYLVGLGVGCAFGAGVVLSIKSSLLPDTFALGFFLAAGAGFAIWAFGRRGQPGKRKAVRSKRQTEQTGEDGFYARRSDWACMDCRSSLRLLQNVALNETDKRLLDFFCRTRTQEVDPLSEGARGLHT